MSDNSIVSDVAAASTKLCVSDSIPVTGSNTWIIDTGASNHMTYYAKFFDELSSNTRDPYITSANGLPSPITGSQDPRDDWARFKCKTCILAKSHHTVFPLSDSKTAKPFDLVHSDVWGPARVTSNGFRWFVTFIDDCTRLTWVFLLKNKHDVASILPEFCTMVSTQFHAQVKIFRIDNGGEYVNNTLASFFRAQGIIHQTTTSFTPQQNGVSERKNRQLLEVARSLMLDMSVPHHILGHVVLSAAYLINRTPNRILDFKTLHDVFGDHVSPVSVSKLPPKVFECVVYVHVYSHQRSKLDSCALRYVLYWLLVYSERGRGGVNWRVLDWRMMCLKILLSGRKRHVALKQVTGHPYLKMKLVVPVKKRLIALLELDQSPISKDEAGDLGVETTSHTEASDQLPVFENNDSDSFMDEFDQYPNLPCQCPNLLMIVNQVR
ncbi:hypothetical protein L3X38_016380 [Prunus dulcis]|uniref:Integrase catalytic domain-containing protein n=1 Tax=Prunus dulcis TaxID=3755 RepID=A0AAD4W7Q9_PRUDU|nr:hypothetical protein L3X38_016380 [Prunus dulcis]